MSADKLFFPDHLWTNCWTVKESLHRSVQNTPSLSKKALTTPPASDIDIEGIRDDAPDITTVVTTRAVMRVEGEITGNDTTRSVTQVGLRTVKSSLGGQDDGVWG